MQTPLDEPIGDPVPGIEHDRGGKDHLIARQLEAAGACDLYAIQDDLDFFRIQLARLPTRKEVDAGDARRCGSGGHLDRGVRTVLALGLVNRVACKP